MRKIGLLEVSHHPHILYYLSKMSDVSKNDVTVFTTDDLFEKVRGLYNEGEIDDYDWRIKQDNESLKEYLGRVERISSSELDIVSVNTALAEGHVTSNFLGFDPDCKSLLWIYDVRRWFRRYPSLLYDAAAIANEPIRKYTPSVVSDFVLEHFKNLLPPKILENHDAVCVEYPPLKEYLGKHREWNKPTYTLPLTLYQDHKKYQTTSRDRIFRVVVPGRLSKDVRDYDTVLDVFERLFERHGGNVALDLLGKPVDGYPDITRRCKELSDKGHNLNFYSGWVSQEEFTEAIRNSDVVLSPVVVDRRMKHPLKPDKIMGTTQGTGVVFDAIRHAKPLVLPDDFQIDGMIEDVTITYGSSEDLFGILDRLVKNKSELEIMKQAAHRNSENYALEPQQQRLQEIVDDLLN